MRHVAFAFLTAALAVGCRTKSPYDYTENWVIRDNAIRPFAVAADIIYLQDRLYDDIKAVPLMNYRARQEVGNGRFDGFARVFSPLVANADDLALAMKWFFRNREGERPFVFIGEGAGGELLRAYETENLDSLKSKGLVVSFYSEFENGPFVNAGMLTEIRNAILRSRYRETWGREIPEGLLTK